MKSLVSGLVALVLAGCSNLPQSRLSTESLPTTQSEYDVSSSLRETEVITRIEEQPERNKIKLESEESPARRLYNYVIEEGNSILGEVYFMELPGRVGEKFEVYAFLKPTELIEINLVKGNNKKVFKDFGVRNKLDEAFFIETNPEEKSPKKRSKVRIYDDMKEVSEQYRIILERINEYIEKQERYREIEKSIDEATKRIDIT